MKYYLPRDLQEIVSGVVGDNVSLELTKFVPFFADRGDEKPNLREFIEERLKKRLKLRNLRIPLPDEAKLQYENFFGELVALWKSTNSEQFSMKTKSRLIIGLGDESVYETSIRLHRNYGVPYIPGSALKGVTKHYIFSVMAEEKGDEILRSYEEVKTEVKKRIAKKEKISVEKIQEDYYLAIAVIQEVVERKFVELEKIGSMNVDVGSTALEVKELVEIFGTQKQEGSIIFFDAFPTPDQLRNNPILELDIMNPHYQPYYSASENELKSRPEKAPGDWHQPNPIFFLTVPAGVEFQFAIAPRDTSGERLLDKTKEILISALREFGVGAKTSLGYGRFEK